MLIVQYLLVVSNFLSKKILKIFNCAFILLQNVYEVSLLVYRLS